jgi:hypothetical protein
LERVQTKFYGIEILEFGEAMPDRQRHCQNAAMELYRRKPQRRNIEKIWRFEVQNRKDAGMGGKMKRNKTGAIEKSIVNIFD